MLLQHRHGFRGHSLELLTLKLKHLKAKSQKNRTIEGQVKVLHFDISSCISNQILLTTVVNDTRKIHKKLNFQMTTISPKWWV
jgi:hypothetical protein